MASKQITLGIGIPMIVVGAILAVVLAAVQQDLSDTVQFVGGLIGILGVVIFIPGLFARKPQKIVS